MSLLKTGAGFTEALFSKGILFSDHTAYALFPKVAFGKSARWKIKLHFKEYHNDSNINFFFGERGSRFNGFARVKNKIMYRLADGSYIGGLTYNLNESIKLEVHYDQGLWTFSDGINTVSAECKSDVLFNSIGSGFNGKELEEKISISYASIEQFSDASGEYETIGEWELNENAGCIAFDTSGFQHHAVLHNIEWECCERKNKKISPILMDQSAWQGYVHHKPHKIFSFARTIYEAEKDSFLEKIVQGVMSEKNRQQGEKLFNNIYHFDRFEPAELPIALTWKEDPFNSRSWKWQLHQWVFYAGLIAAHGATGNDKYLDRLLQLVRSWYECNYTKDYPSELSWHDHSTALRLRTLIYVWEYLRCSTFQMDEQSINLFLNLIETHCNVLSSKDFYNQHNNHGFDQSMFLYLASVKFPEFESAKIWHTIALDRLIDEISVAFTSEGMHVENSPSYLVNMLQRVHLASKMMLYYESEKCIELDIIVDSALKSLSYLMLPDGTLPMLGDTDLGSLIPAMKHLKGYSNFNFFQYTYSKGEDGCTVTYPVDAVFAESGYAVFRDRWHVKSTFEQMTQLVFKCGFLSTFHRHDDDLNFILYGLGEYWFVDGGIYQYDEKDRYRQYLRSARAHNIPVIPNITPLRKLSSDASKQSGIVDYNLEDNASWVKAESYMNPGFCVTRKIEYLRPNRFIIIDNVKAESNDYLHSYELMFHIPLDKRIILQKDNKVIIKGEKSHQLEMLFDGDCSFEFCLSSGMQDGEILGWQSKKFNHLDEIQTLRCEVVPLHKGAVSIVELTLYN